MQRPVAFAGAAVLTLTERTAAVGTARDATGGAAARTSGAGTVAGDADTDGASCCESTGAGIGVVVGRSAAGGVGVRCRAAIADGRTVDGGGVRTLWSSTTVSGVTAGGGAGLPCARAGEAASASDISDSAATPSEREIACVMA